MKRKVVTRAPSREVGIVNASWLLDHGVQHESFLEKRFVMVALSCPVVADVVDQPFEVKLGFDDCAKYTPDFLVTFVNNEKIVVEVKPEAHLAELQPRLGAIRQALTTMGYEFLVITDKEIDAHGLSSRALLLMRYGRLFLNPAQALDCRRILEEKLQGSAQVRDLLAHGVAEEVVWNLVACHQLKVPAGISITSDETVSVPNDKEDCHAVFCTWFGLE